MEKGDDKPRYALCIENRDCEDLEKRKVYQVLTDEAAQKDGYLRVLDESGEDYLFQENDFGKARGRNPRRRTSCIPPVAGHKEFRPITQPKSFY